MQMDLYSILLIIGCALGFVVVIVVVAEIGEWKRHRELLKIAKEKPELLHQIHQMRLPGKTIPTYIPRKVKVVVVDGDSNVEDICTMSSDRMIRCRNIEMSFIVPEDYKPKITFHRKKTYLTYFFTRNGQAVSMQSPSEIQVHTPSPSMVEAIINRRLLEQIFRSLRMDLTALLTGTMLGGFIAMIIVFVMLPILGIPVTIGRQPVEVVHIQQPPVEIQPPGNYTIPIGG